MKTVVVTNIFSVGCSVVEAYDGWIINPFLHIYSFYHAKEKSCRKTLWKKVKLLKMSNMTCLHNVSYAVSIICILKCFNNPATVFFFLSLNGSVLRIHSQCQKMTIFPKIKLNKIPKTKDFLNLDPKSRIKE